MVALDALPPGLADDAKLYIKPLAQAPASIGSTEGDERHIAGSGPRCRQVEILIRQSDRVATRIEAIDVVDQWRCVLRDDHALRVVRQLGHAFKQPEPFAGLDLSEPQVMGVVNVTPDSFSDGGDVFDHGDAVARAGELAADGAAILDIGGESTRPGAVSVGAEEEIRRIEPVIRGLANGGARLSIDSRKSEVMAAALDAGATIVNDASALTHDPTALDLVADRGVAVVLMHAQGDPRTMQAAPAYDHVSLDVFDYLEARVEVCLERGLDRSAIAVDPGFGFGKTDKHNLTLMRDLPLFHALGCPVLLGASRKRTIERIAGQAAPKERLGGSLALALAGLRAGVQILRVHDVAETRQAIQVWQAVEGRGGER